MYFAESKFKFSTEAYTLRSSHLLSLAVIIRSSTNNFISLLLPLVCHCSSYIDLKTSSSPSMWQILRSSTYLYPVHFVNDEYGGGVHSNDDGVECIPDRCNSTLSRSTGRAGSRLLTHARCTLSQNNSTGTTKRIAVTSRYLLGHQ